MPYYAVSGDITFIRGPLVSVADVSLTLEAHCVACARERAIGVAFESSGMLGGYNVLDNIEIHLVSEGKNDKVH